MRLLTRQGVALTPVSPSRVAKKMRATLAAFAPDPV
jgi:hypothetical protein